MSRQYFLPLIKQYFEANGVMAEVGTLADTTIAIIAGAATLCDE